jgi:hypothetical protein
MYVKIMMAQPRQKSLLRKFFIHPLSFGLSFSQGEAPNRLVSLNTSTCGASASH